MHKLLNLISISKPYLVIIGFLCIVCGLIISKFLLSVGMFILIGNFFILNPDLKKNLQSLKIHQSHLVITFLFFLYLVSIFYSSDYGYALERLRIKLPFLFLPLAFIPLLSLSKKTYYSLLGFYVIIIFMTAVGIFVNYLINSDSLDDAILHGKALPTPVNHIRFSLMMVLAIATSLYLYMKKFRFFSKTDSFILMGICIFLIILLHIFAVRSGIVTFYAAAILVAVKYSFDKRRYWIGIIVIAAVVAAPVVAYFSIDTFKNKVDYMRYDISLFLSGNEYEGLSDSKRLASIQAGLAVGNNHPIVGVGIGDVRQGVNKKYDERYNFVDRDTIIHNQYIFIYAALGITGLIISLLIFLFPLVTKRHFQSWYFLSINIVLLLSFIVEATLETQVGTALYLFFILMGLNILIKEQAESKALSDTSYSARKSGEVTL